MDLPLEVLLHVVMPTVYETDFATAVQLSKTCTHLERQWHLGVRRLPAACEAIIPQISLRRFINLRKLNLCNNTGIKTIDWKMPHLAELKLWHRAYDHIRIRWTLMTNLTSLDARYYPVSSDILCLVNLRTLKMNVCNMHISKIASLTNLTKLSMTDPRNFRQSQVTVLTQLRSLLIVDGSNISFTTNLTSLRCYNGRPNDLSMLTNLKKMYVDTLGLTDVPASITDMSVDIFLQWMSSLTNLTKLRIHSCPPTDAIGLTNLTNLTDLTVGHGSTTLPDAIEPLVNLRSLTLGAECHVTIATLTKLSNLTSLNLGHNDLTDLGLLTNLRSLRIGWADSTPIDDVSKLFNLTKLDWPVFQRVDGHRLSKLTNLRELTVPNISADFRKRHQTRILIIETAPIRDKKK